ncbi:YcxB family protein [Acholeplasma equirhinis]|uniref:YcxB family protein n=1 Tax=Acholeplasma equirhinis TaxID=555393 RepID=UPI00197AB39F|nr:YcxB family protein [Acholeplasma equirhinis]MBN3490326.1 YcxB family protein [Acholeplasma equirhinis]
MIIMFSVFVIASILSIFIVPKVIKKQVEKNFIKNLKEKNMLEMVIHYDFEENYIESLIKGSIGKTDYNQFDRLSETSNLFLIHLNGQTEAVVIPKRCFEDEMQVIDFKKFIERKLKENKSL